MFNSSSQKITSSTQSWSLARRINFGSSLLEEEDLQEDLSLELVSLDLL